MQMWKHILFLMIMKIREYMLNNNFYPDNEDPDRGGLGMQVRTRGFQWSQVLAEDAIFWFYEITNMGTTDYEKTLFAQYVDWGIGGMIIHLIMPEIIMNYWIFPMPGQLSWRLAPLVIGVRLVIQLMLFLKVPVFRMTEVIMIRMGLTDEKRDNESNCIY